MRAFPLAFSLGVVLCLCGCISPKPRGFVDTDALPSLFVGRAHQAYATGKKLVIEVSQIPGGNVARIDAFEQEGALYLEPFRISSGGNGTSRFELDVTNHKLQEDWHQHVYWVVESYGYPFITGGFWSKAKQAPWVRKRVYVVVR